MSRLLLVLLLIATSLMPSAMPAAASAPASYSVALRDPSLARLEPASGTYWGVNLDWEHDSPADFNQRVGKPAAVYVQFMRLPFATEDQGTLDGFIDQVAAQHGIALLTLLPVDGLQAVTPAVADDLANRLAAINARGVPVLVRYAHEMNGSWYPWGQQPEAYVQSFRLVADAVHRGAPLAAMLWAPNYGSGYPYTGGQYTATPGSVEFRTLDTNADGVISMTDDPYAPYYPGDDAVDWVGLSLYHWGYEYPWGANVVPQDGKFVGELTSTYSTPNSDERTLPNFYRIYADAHAKPMAIPETGAFFRPSVQGADEQAIKRAWLSQVTDASIAEQLPRIKLISWFEWRKNETEVNDVVDWRISADPDLASAVREALAGSQWLSADDVAQSVGLS
jgi:hypothetical protein